MPKQTEFTPKWCEETPEGTYRSLFKYGDPEVFKHPNPGMYKIVKEVFGMTDTDFQKPMLSFERFDIEIPSSLSANH